MINLLIEKNKHKITIDKLIINENNNQRLIIDEDEILSQTNLHFQMVANVINKEKEIPEEWTHAYEEQSHIDNNIYNNLMCPINLEELKNVIHNLASNKATGSSKISNEIIKHLKDNTITLIKDLMNDCLQESDILVEWKYANIYPIPKPKEWSCDLNNTRPITLLETMRKILVKILNNHLAKIFVKNKVLQGYQFAGLPGQSTFEPLRIINEIINDANCND